MKMKLKLWNSSRLNVHIVRSIYLHVLGNGSTLDMIICKQCAKNQNETANSQEVIEEERSKNELMTRMDLYDKPKTYYTWTELLISCVVKSIDIAVAL